jgi:ABC-type transport system involved in Fe-S cluster assembly fused permease/ATPase subunit
VVPENSFLIPKSQNHNSRRGLDKRKSKKRFNGKIKEKTMSEQPVIFQDVSFAYDTAANPLLESVSIHFPLGWTGQSPGFTVYPMPGKSAR